MRVTLSQTGDAGYYTVEIILWMLTLWEPYIAMGFPPYYLIEWYYLGNASPNPDRWPSVETQCALRWQRDCNTYRKIINTFSLLLTYLDKRWYNEFIVNASVNISRKNGTEIAETQ